MADEIALRFAYAEQDFVDAAEEYRSPKRLPYVIAWFVVSLLSLLAWRFSVVPLDLFVAVSVGLAFCLFVFLPLVANFMTRKEFRADHDVKDEVQLTFSEAGVMASSTSIAGKNYWSVFSSAIETDEAILLFYGENSYLIVPRRSFADPADEEALKRLILSKVPNFKATTCTVPSLGRVARPILALVFSVLILTAGCFAVSLWVSRAANQPPAEPAQDSQTSETKESDQ